MTCSILDEGKGKCITYLCSNDKPSIIARAGVGPNAGHSVEFNGEKYGLRLTPSGFVHTDAKLMIGAGVLVNPDVLYKEFDDLAKYNVKERMSIDSRCAIITEDHMARDKSSEHLAKKIGSTGSGCGPANSDRVMRTIKLARDYPELEEYITDVSLEINEAINDGEEVFIEGSQGFALSLYYGTYPFVTSKDTTASTFAADVGVGPTKVDEVIDVFKAYISRVGEGPFPTEMTPEEAESRGWEEYGVVTGRRRRIGYFDMDLAKESCRINGATQIALTCVDKLYPDCARTQDYNDLSAETKAFINDIESETNVPVTIISTGPDLKDTIDLRKELL